ncbi:MAG TPA: hypothetical protein VGR52_02980 [Stellaceae bacterium]|nr:hypothetical protein [Stellaceae bacterium]
MMAPRETLRAAIADRETARKAKAEAANTLKRADSVLAATQTERDRAIAALSKAEQDHARLIAKAIRAGKATDVAVTQAIKAAHAALAEIASRARMAETAHKQIADELAAAERALVDAESTVSAVALAVVVAEVEIASEPLAALLSQICAIDDLVFGVSHLWEGDRAISLTDKLRNVVVRLRPIRQMLAQVRPQRIILTGTSEAEIAGRLQDYRKALMANPDATLAEIAPPAMAVPTLPPTNEIEKARERGELNVRVA